jgi:predicted RNase H-like HicB family nuclease
MVSNKRPATFRKNTVPASKYSVFEIVAGPTGFEPTGVRLRSSLPDLYRTPRLYLSVKRAEVKGRRFTVVLRQEDVGGYSVRCVEIPAAITQGETRSEALKNIKEAIKLYLEAFPDESKLIEELGRVTGKKEVVEVTV